MSEFSRDLETAGGSQASADLALFEQYLDADSGIEQPGRGDLREGVIVEIRPNELLVNVGSKRDGIVPQSDLSKMDQSFIKSLEVGQTVDVVVVHQEDDGVFLLSMADAAQQRDWLTAEKLLESGNITTHKVIGHNKGGLTVEFYHLRGFVPASHVMDMPRNMTEDQRRDEMEERINEVMRLKVIEVDHRRRRLVMSQTQAERESRDQARSNLFATLKVGDVIRGTVRSMRPFGAFVDIGGADGLLHVGEIDWGQVAHPKDVISVGQQMDVQVIRVDHENQRIGLSRKRVLGNPWQTIESRYQQGQIVPATVTRLADFGAFAQIEAGVEGLIHISELADISVAEPLKSVQNGDKIMVKILRIEGKRQRIGLSRRQAIEAAAQAS